MFVWWRTTWPECQTSRDVMICGKQLKLFQRCVCVCMCVCVCVCGSSRLRIKGNSLYMVLFTHTHTVHIRRYKRAYYMCMYVCEGLCICLLSTHTYCVREKYISIQYGNPRVDYSHMLIVLILCSVILLCTLSSKPKYLSFFHSHTGSIMCTGQLCIVVLFAVVWLPDVPRCRTPRHQLEC